MASLCNVPLRKDGSSGNGAIYASRHASLDRYGSHSAVCIYIRTNRPTYTEFHVSNARVLSARLVGLESPASDAFGWWNTAGAGARGRRFRHIEQHGETISRSG